MSNKTGWTAYRIGSRTVKVQTFLLFTVPQPSYHFIPMELESPKSDVVGLTLITDVQPPEKGNRFLRSVEGIVEDVAVHVKAVIISQEGEKSVTVPVED